MIKKLTTKIDELFNQTAGSAGTIDFKAASRLMWITLNNSVSIIDLAGVYTVSSPGTEVELLTNDLFADFLKSFAKVKYPIEPDSLEKLVAELRSSNLPKFNSELQSFTMITDKNVIRVLMKYDIALRKVFSNYCGQSVRIGGNLTWDEVKNMSIGMEIDGFITMAGVHGLIPRSITTQECETLFREVLNRYPLLGNAATLNSSILYPQFQMLLIMIAIDRNDSAVRDQIQNEKFAKKTSELKSKPLPEVLNGLLRDMGINRDGNPTKRFDGIVADYNAAQDGIKTIGLTNYQESMNQLIRNHRENDRSQVTKGDSLLTSRNNVILPSTDRPLDHYTSSTNNSRQAMLLRMEHLFDDVETKIIETLEPTTSPVVILLAMPPDEHVEFKVRLPSKPVVISDTLPIPKNCPDAVVQLMEAALAHHNLGSFEEALKFLEAAKVRYSEHKIHIATPKTKGILGSPTMKSPSNIAFIQRVESLPHIGHGHDKKGGSSMERLDSDIFMYTTMCKGNIYQSCGDDEQSLLHYMEAWAKAKDGVLSTNETVDKSTDDQQNEGHSYSFFRDWAMVALNSIGLLAYYNLRYDVALLCFDAVHEYRSKVHGEDSPDSASALNNAACSLYCLHHRGESRIRFEKSWMALSKSIGHRTPRTLTAWKNLEKSRRSHAPLRNQRDMKESLEMRPDADRLLFGGSFTIQAIPPPETKKGGKKKKKGKKG